MTTATSCSTYLIQVYTIVKDTTHSLNMQQLREHSISLMMGIHFKQFNGEIVNIVKLKITL